MKNRFSGSESGARPEKRFLAWSVMAALLLATAPLAAKERKGAQVAVQRSDGSEIRGELLMFKRDCLVLGEQAKGEIVALADVRSLRIVRRSKGGYGFLFGLIGGSLLGYEVVHANNSDFSGQDAFMAGSVLFGLPCALLGAGVGLLEGTDLVRNPSEWEPEAYLAELNRHARVRDAALSAGQK